MVNIQTQSSEDNNNMCNTNVWMFVSVLQMATD
jgi:hypothetical protein